MNNLPKLINAKYIISPNELEKFLYNLFLDEFYFSNVKAKTYTLDNKFGHISIINSGGKYPTVSIKFINSMMVPQCSKLTKKIEDCIVCFNETLNKTLCNHVVCTECIDSILEKHKQFKCPYCRKMYNNHLVEILITKKNKKKIMKKYNTK
jgi:hypothetical protein